MSFDKQLIPSRLQVLVFLAKSICIKTLTNIAIPIKMIGTRRTLSKYAYDIDIGALGGI